MGKVTIELTLHEWHKERDKLRPFFECLNNLALQEDKSIFHHWQIDPALFEFRWRQIAVVLRRQFTMSAKTMNGASPRELQEQAKDAEMCHVQGTLLRLKNDMNSWITQGDLAPWFCWLHRINPGGLGWKLPSEAECDQLSGHQGDALEILENDDDDDGLLDHEIRIRNDLLSRLENSGESMRKLNAALLGAGPEYMPWTFASNDAEAVIEMVYISLSKRVERHLSSDDDYEVTLANARLFIQNLHWIETRKVLWVWPEMLHRWLPEVFSKNPREVSDPSQPLLKQTNTMCIDHLHTFYEQKREQAKTNFASDMKSLINKMYEKVKEKQGDSLFHGRDADQIWEAWEECIHQQSGKDFEEYYWLFQKDKQQLRSWKDARNTSAWLEEVAKRLGVPQSEPPATTDMGTISDEQLMKDLEDLYDNNGDDPVDSSDGPADCSDSSGWSSRDECDYYNPDEDEIVPEPYVDPDAIPNIPSSKGNVEVESSHESEEDVDSSHEFEEEVDSSHDSEEEVDSIYGAEEADDPSHETEEVADEIAQLPPLPKNPFAEDGFSFNAPLSSPTVATTPFNPFVPPTGNVTASTPSNPVGTSTGNGGAAANTPSIVLSPPASNVLAVNVNAITPWTPFNDLAPNLAGSSAASSTAVTSESTTSPSAPSYSSNSGSYVKIPNPTSPVIFSPTSPGGLSSFLTATTAKPNPTSLSAYKPGSYIPQGQGSGSAPKITVSSKPNPTSLMAYNPRASTSPPIDPRLLALSPTGLNPPPLFPNRPAAKPKSPPTAVSNSSGATNQNTATSDFGPSQQNTPAETQKPDPAAPRKILQPRSRAGKVAEETARRKAEEERRKAEEEAAQKKAKEESQKANEVHQKVEEQLKMAVEEATRQKANAEAFQAINIFLQQQVHELQEKNAQHENNASVAGAEASQATVQALQQQVQELQEEKAQLEITVNVARAEACQAANQVQQQLEKIAQLENTVNVASAEQQVMHQEHDLFVKRAEQENAGLLERDAQSQAQLAEASKIVTDLNSEVGSVREQLQQKEQELVGFEEAARANMAELRAALEQEKAELKCAHDSELLSAKSTIETLQKQIEEERFARREVPAPVANPSSPPSNLESELAVLREELGRAKTKLGVERGLHAETRAARANLEKKLDRREHESRKAIAKLTVREADLERELRDVKAALDKHNPRNLLGRFQKTSDFTAEFRQAGPEKFVEMLGEGLKGLAKFEAEPADFHHKYAQSVAGVTAHLVEVEHGCDLEVYAAAEQAYDYHEHNAKFMLDSGNWLDRNQLSTTGAPLAKLNKALEKEKAARSALLGPETELAALLKEYQEVKRAVADLKEAAKSPMPMTWLRKVCGKSKGMLEADVPIAQHINKAKKMREQAKDLLRKAEICRLEYGKSVRKVKLLFKQWADGQNSYNEPAKSERLCRVYEHKLLPSWLQLRRTIEKYHEEFELAAPRFRFDSGYEATHFVFVTSAGQPPQDLLWQQALTDLNDFNKKIGIPVFEHVVGSRYTQVKEVTVPKSVLAPLFDRPVEPQLRSDPLVSHQEFNVLAIIAVVASAAIEIGARFA